MDLVLALLTLKINSYMHRGRDYEYAGKLKRVFLLLGSHASRAHESNMGEDSVMKREPLLFTIANVPEQSLNVRRIRRAWYGSGMA